VTGDVAAEISRLRAGLRGGRGPGASEAEVDAQTSERTLYAGRPVVEQLAQLHARTAVARGDAEALRRDLARARNQLAVDVDRLAGRLRPSLSATALPRLVAAVVVLVMLACLRRRRRHAPGP